MSGKRAFIASVPLVSRLVQYSPSMRAGGSPKMVRNVPPRCSGLVLRSGSFGVLR